VCGWIIGLSGDRAFECCSCVIQLDQIDWSQYLPPPGFHVLARRWVVERTFAWLLFNRRLSRDDERLCATTETWIYLAMIRLMVRRLVRMH
jgi:transposase